MEYQLYTDKGTTFECKIDLDGASLNETTARIIVDAGNRKLMFTGSITNEGYCSIPITKLRGLLDENSTGTISLEVISEDTYFKPWSSPFSVTPSKKLTVEVASAPPSKPTMKVQVQQQAKTPKAVPAPQTATTRLISEIASGLRKKGVNATNVLKNKTMVRSAISESLLEQDVETLMEIDGDKIISGVVKMLAQR